MVVFNRTGLGLLLTIGVCSTGTRLEIDGRAAVGFVTTAGFLIPLGLTAAVVEVVLGFLLTRFSFLVSGESRSRTRSISDLRSFETMEGRAEVADGLVLTAGLVTGLGTAAVVGLAEAKEGRDDVMEGSVAGVIDGREETLLDVLAGAGAVVPTTDNRGVGLAAVDEAIDGRGADVAVEGRETVALGFLMPEVVEEAMEGRGAGTAEGLLLVAGLAATPVRTEVVVAPVDVRWTLPAVVTLAAAG